MDGFGLVVLIVCVGLWWLFFRQAPRLPPAPGTCREVFHHGHRIPNSAGAGFHIESSYTHCGEPVVPGSGFCQRHKDAHDQLLRAQKRRF